jgi:hypothetical protein
VPSGENQWTQILAGKRLRDKGDLSKLQAKLWRGIAVAEGGMLLAMADDNEESVRKWLHCLSQIAGTYAKIVIDGDLERRIKLLEDAVS